MQEADYKAAPVVKLESLSDVNDIGKPWRYEEDGLTVTRTCPWSPPGCHPVGCGLKLYVNDEGRLVKVEGDEKEAYRLVQETYKKVYHEDLAQESPYLSQKIAEVYKEQTRIVRILTIFSFLAVLISLLGLVAMSTYFIQQRSKEIAIRKVFGSTSNRIRRDLIRTFLQYVAVAFVISVPVIWYFAGEWISQYSYRIVWWPWIIVAGILVLLISFCAVAVQSYMASNENPVKNIKQE